MAALTEPQRQFLDRSPYVGTVTTLRADGSPHSTIEFQVAGGCGLGTLDAAKEKHIWGIGVDADQSYLGPHVLTSATKRVDQAVFLTVKDVQDGKFRGGRNAIFGLAQNGVGLGKISPNVPKQDVTAVDKIRQEIIAGKIRDIPTTVS